MAARSTRRDASGALNPQLARLRRFQAVLEPLGLWGKFTAMPKPIQQFFLRMKFADPQVVFADSVPQDATYRAIRREMETGLKAARIEVDGRPLRALELFTTVQGLGAAVEAMRAAADELRAERIAMPEVEQFVEAAAPALLQFFNEHMLKASQALQAPTLVPVLSRCKLDEQWFDVRLERTEGVRGKTVARTMISAARAEVRDVALDGVTRRMYRALTTTLSAGIEPVSWKDPDRPDGAELPVYVQAHALRQLTARVNHPDVAPYAQCWMGESLGEPKFVSRTSNGDWLVEYRVKEHRVGYFVVTALRGAFVVRTFLFLTMKDTPEGRRLEKRLKVTRREVKYLGLDQLLSFTHTDLRDDKTLVDLLTACGCGHLFDLGDVTPQPKPMAEQVRKFLRLAA